LEISKVDAVSSILRKKSELIPFLKFCTLAETKESVLVSFSSKIPNVVKSRLLDMTTDIEQEVGKIISSNVTIKFEFDNSVIDVKDNRENTKDEIKDNPLVKEVLQLFDGEIVKIIKIKR